MNKIRKKISILTLQPLSRMDFNSDNDQGVYKYQVSGTFVSCDRELLRPLCLENISMEFGSKTSISSAIFAVMDFFH